MSCPQDTSVGERWWIGQTARELRHRTGYNAFGAGVHGIVHAPANTETIKVGFRDDTDNWIEDLSYYSNTFGPGGVSWVGEVGICVDKPGMHGEARAFDLTAIRFSNGDVFDSNVSWQAGTEGKRLYVAVAAQCRRHFGVVLTAWYNSDHQNHIHFDNSAEPVVIRESSRADTCIVQAAGVFLNGESIAIDGNWGPATQDAYLRLITDFNMKCFDPKTNSTHAKKFLAMIAQHGFANRAAGYYQDNC